MHDSAFLFSALQLFPKIVISHYLFSLSLISGVVDRQTSDTCEIKEAELAPKTGESCCARANRCALLFFFPFSKDFAKDRYGASAMIQSQQKLG